MTTMLEQAHELFDTYAPPGVDFEWSLRWQESEYRTYEDGCSTVFWCVGDGLSALLHELGHAVLRHRKELPWRANMVQEVEAWLWAEKTARKESIPFDYGGAEDDMKAYFRDAKKRPLFTINWRYK